VGRTGVLTPVAVLDPVRIHGVEISSATLHNKDEIVRKDIRIGDQVIVERAGDVIPKVARSLPELRTGAERVFVMPSSCPACGSDVVRMESEVAHRCVNPVCPARLKQSILHFISKGGLDVEGMGPQLIAQLVDRGIVNSLADVLRLERNQLIELDRQGPTSIDRLLAALDRAKHVTLARFLFALGIPGVGAHLSSVLAKQFQTIDALAQADEESLSAIHEIGPLSAQAIAAFFSNDQVEQSLRDFRDAGLVLVEPADDTGEGALKNMRFVFTGSLSTLTRSQAGALVEAQGGIITSSVGKNTDYVVVGDSPGSKADRARELGVALLDESEFLEMLKSYE
jgi:DNA ligase (NAD+)